MFLSLYGLLIVQFYQKAYALTNTQIQLNIAGPIQFQLQLQFQFQFEAHQIKIFRLLHDTDADEESRERERQILSGATLFSTSVHSLWVRSAWGDNKPQSEPEIGYNFYLFCAQDSPDRAVQVRVSVLSSQSLVVASFGIWCANLLFNLRNTQLSSPVGRFRPCPKCELCINCAGSSHRYICIFLRYTDIWTGLALGIDLDIYSAIC